MHRHHAARLDVGGGLRGLFGEHVVVGPAAVVLDVLDECDAKVRKASADFGKVRAVGRIAAVVNRLAAVLQHKAAPETSGPIAQTAARRLERRHQRDAQVAALRVLPRVQFGDVRHAQRLQICIQSQRHDEVRRCLRQGALRVLLEMVVVVVRQQHHVGLRPIGQQRGGRLKAPHVHGERRHRRPEHQVTPRSCCGLTFICRAASKWGLWG